VTRREEQSRDADLEAGRAPLGETRETEHEEVPTQVQLLPIYLREMGATPLLARDEEVRLARELDEARREFARRIQRLPADCRAHVLAGDTKGPQRGAQWPLDSLEAAWDRLLVYARDPRERAAQEQLAALRPVKARLDRARDALIVANLRLVTHIVKKYGNQGIPFMDLIQEGNIGLMKAVEKFEYRRGYKFSTYAYWWIKQAISRAIADKARVIRIPVHITEKLKKVRRVAAELRDELGRAPTDREIARKLRMSVKKVEEVMSVVQDPQPLELVGADEDGLGALPFVSDPNAIDPLRRALDLELESKMRSALRVLDRREEEVIRMRFGIGRRMRHTLEEIGQELNLSRERVRQIEGIALRKIGQTPESRSLRGAVVHDRAQQPA
jgi:RNA polymerase sigma factor (sigma-70 family)